MRGHDEYKKWRENIESVDQANTCTHRPPRQTKGLPMGITDTCTCRATTYVLRYSGNDGSGKVRKRWDYWEGERP